MKKIIDSEFQTKVKSMVEGGDTQYRVAKRLGVSRPTIRRALAALAAAMAEAGAAHSVHSERSDMDAMPSAPAVVATYAPRLPRPRFGLRLACC